MKSIKKVLTILAVLILVAMGLIAAFRDQVRIAAVRTYVKHWTQVLLEGAAIDDDEKARIGKSVGDFCGLVKRDLVPERTVRQLWEDSLRNLGFAYFYMKNFLTREIRESGMDALAREKALAIVDKFLGYIRDGRVHTDDLEDLSTSMKVIGLEEDAVTGVSTQELQKTVWHIDSINGRLEKQGPGRPVDPVERFRSVIERIDRLIERYSP